MWNRNCWCLAVIFLILLFCIRGGFAKNISLEYNSEVRIGEIFDIKIFLIDFENKIYDIKVDINENNRIAKIWDGSKWQSTSYYVNSAINLEENKTIVQLNITEDYLGIGEIIVKIRENGKTSTDKFEGYKIGVLEKEIIESTSEQEKIEEISEQETKVNEKEQEKIEEISEQEVETLSKSSENGEESIIYLMPKNLKTSEDNQVVFKSGNEKIKQYAVYGFILFLVAIIILLLIDKRY